MSEAAVPTVEEDLAYLRRLVDSDRGTRVRVLRREPRIALVAFGWYVAALLTGFNMRMPDFLLYMGISMLVLMALPGWLMVRRNAAAAA